MAQELIKTSGEEAAQLHALVGSLYGTIGRDDRHRCDTLPARINSETRKDLQAYRQHLHSRLQPICNSLAERERAKSALQVFLGGYLNIKADREGASNSYIEMMRDQPLFAIMRAIDDFKDGRVFDIGREGERIPFTLDHAPSAPRMLDQIKKRAADVQAERHKVTRLLAIEKVSEPEVSEAERERVAAHMRGLADSLTMKATNIRVEELKKVREEAQAARDRSARIIQEARQRREEADFASQAEQANG